MSGSDTPSLSADYRAAHESVAFAELSGLGLLSFKGPDRRKFLHGLLTNDVLGLKEGAGVPACLLTPKGKLVAYFPLYDRGEDLLAVDSSAAAAAVMRALSRNLILSEGTGMDDLGGSFKVVAVIGPRAAELLERVLPGGGLEAAYSCARLSWAGAQICVLAYPLFGPTGLLVLSPAERAAVLMVELAEKGGDLGAAVAGRQVLDLLRVEAGMPAFGVDWDADAFPLELGLGAAVSYDKGCYLGQEVTARLKHLGHVNRRLVGLKVEGRPASGSEVVCDGRVIGKVGSVADCPRLGCALALAVVRDEHSRPGMALQVTHATAWLRAEVAALPLLPGAK